MKYSFSSSSERGFIKSDENATTVIFEKIVALLPAFIWACFHFGEKTALTVIISTAFSLLIGTVAKTVFLSVRNKKYTAGFSLLFALEGMIVALAMPHNVKLWVVIAASAPAVLLTALWPFGAGIFPLSPAALSVSAITLITKDFTAGWALTSERLTYPLDIVCSGEMPDITMTDLMLGNVDGKIGEISAALLVAGMLYLVIRKHVSWMIPVTSAVVVGFLTNQFAPENVAYFPFVGSMLCSGGLLFASIFIAADPARLPVSSVGRIIIGLLIGGMTFAFRYFLKTDGIYYSIIIAQILTPVIENLTEPSVYGMISGNKKSKKKDPQKSEK